MEPDNLRHIAELLLRYEAVAGNSGSGTAAFRVTEKLRHHLTSLLGAIGFRELLGRAVLLAKAEVPELSPVQVKADGSLEGLSNKDGRRRDSGEVTLIARLLGLLDTFVGQALMLRIVQGVWPQATVEALRKKEAHG